MSAESTVPYVLPSSRRSYSSAWIGIDGFANKNLIQTGTSHNWLKGKPVYYAWWGILPETETIIPHPACPGDCMRGSITKITRLLCQR
ncbi:G1 family glutamic endopeptidase [Paenibacillus sp. 4624]|uniref:G1 family glutamic endopeptidase n=1 Tax=Paenibacillus sp. 4624 TaxID=3156453 RepID=UPI003D205111